MRKIGFRVRDPATNLYWDGAIYNPKFLKEGKTFRDKRTAAARTQQYLFRVLTQDSAARPRHMMKLSFDAPMLLDIVEVEIVETEMSISPVAVSNTTEVLVKILNNHGYAFSNLAAELFKHKTKGKTFRYLVSFGSKWDSDPKQTFLKFSKSFADRSKSLRLDGGMAILSDVEMIMVRSMSPSLEIVDLSEYR